VNSFQAPPDCHPPSLPIFTHMQNAMSLFGIYMISIYSHLRILIGNPISIYRCLKEPKPPSPRAAHPFSPTLGVMWGGGLQITTSTQERGAMQARFRLHFPQHQLQNANTSNSFPPIDSVDTRKQHGRCMW
jgi:hypothetical protein